MPEPPDGPKPVTLLGRTLALHGNRDDSYFRNAEAILAAQAPLQAWAQANLPRDAVVIDAGGNIGLTALILSALVPDGHVHVFEALPANAEYLRANIAANGVRNCTVNAVALGSRPGSVPMKASGPGSHVMPGVGGDGATMVPMTTLDSYVEAAGLTRIDFIKMDVEGFEPAVLEGASATVERFRPPVLMEFNTWCLSYIQDFSARDFAFLLWDAFEVRSIDAAGGESPAGGGDVHSFFHDNVVQHGTVEDVLLRLRPGARVPGTDGLKFRSASAQERMETRRHQAEAQALRLQLEAMRRSTSWRVTAPLRALRRLV